VTQIDGGESHALGSRIASLKNWHLFSILTAATLAVTIGTNRIVLSEDVVFRILSPSGTPSAQAVGLLDQVRRWERIAYLLTPALLLARVAVPALLVQLTLLLLGIQKPLASIFRGSLWAQGATWLGSAAQVLWIAAIPASALSATTLDIVPGSLASLLPIAGHTHPTLIFILRQVSIFDFAWITLFATAIEDGISLRARTAFGAVASTWLGIFAVRVGVLFYFQVLR
jgi:hypothetical protein